MKFDEIIEAGCPDCAVLTFNPAAESAVLFPSLVSITSDNPAAVIYYTLDGSTPDATDTPYTAPFLMTAGQTLKAIAYGMDGETVTCTSEVFEAGYTEGECESSLFITLDGTAPTTDSDEYETPITLEEGQKLKLLAATSEGCRSEVMEVTGAECAISGPLDQAIYVASEDAIYGVKGQWVYRFNADTGALENSFRFVEGAMGETCITDVGGFLYIGVAHNVLFPFTGNFDIPSPQDIYKVDYALTTSVGLGLDVAQGQFGSSNIGFAGFTNLVTDGTLIYGHVRNKGLFRVNPTNIATFVNKQSNPFKVDAVLYDLEYDVVNNALWCAGWWAQRFSGVSCTNFNAESDSTPQSSIIGASGVTFCQSNTKIYGVVGGRNVIKGNVDEAPLPLDILTVGDFTYSTLSNILGSGATPIKIKYNAVDGLIYIPTWSGDTVEILDPATDTITSVKTGFSSPFDIVFTPTKKFAVQNSRVGLLKIV